MIGGSYIHIWYISTYTLANSRSASHSPSRSHSPAHRTPQTPHSSRSPRIPRAAARAVPPAVDIAAYRRRCAPDCSIRPPSSGVAGTRTGRARRCGGTSAPPRRRTRTWRTRADNAAKCRTCSSADRTIGGRAQRRRGCRSGTSRTCPASADTGA